MSLVRPDRAVQLNNDMTGIRARRKLSQGIAQPGLIQPVQGRWARSPLDFLRCDKGIAGKNRSGCRNYEKDSERPTSRMLSRLARHYSFFFPSRDTRRGHSRPAPTAPKPTLVGHRLLPKRITQRRWLAAAMQSPRLIRAVDSAC